MFELTRTYIRFSISVCLEMMWNFVFNYYYIMIDLNCTIIKRIK